MIFVGIDVAKDTHYAAVSDDSGAVLVKPFAFQNNAEGFCLLLKKLSEFDRSKLLIGLESTGIYSVSFNASARKSIRSALFIPSMP